MADPPAPGTFVLHSRAVPDLPAGPYTVRATQTITAPGAAATSLDTHIEVTAPRFGLPADQVLSTFPPNQAEGAFSSRLPQIVLKRRTLPWERELDGRLTSSPLPRELPWLALVVLADAECEFRPSQPIAACVTSGVVLEGRNDTPVADAIVVTRRVIDQVFPTKDGASVAGPRSQRRPVRHGARARRRRRLAGGRALQPAAAAGGRATGPA